MNEDMTYSEVSNSAVFKAAILEAIIAKAAAALKTDHKVLFMSFCASMLFVIMLLVGH